MKNAFFIIILVTSSYAFGESIYHEPMLNALEHLETLLPPTLVESWQQISPYLNVEVKPNVQGCVHYYAKSVSDGGTYPTTYRFLDISSDCIGDIQNTPAAFTIADVANNRVLHGLYRVAVELFMQTSASKLNSKKMKKLVYTNHYYMTPLTLGVDINGSVENSLINFWAESSLAYMTDPTLIARHPDVYALLNKYFFGNVEYFSHSGFEVDQTKTSADLYPTFAKIKFLSSGNEAWFMRYQMIKNAQRSIDVEYFTLEDDIFGQSFVALLLEAMARGVHVKIMLDGRGSIVTSRGHLMRALSAGGAETVSYNPLLLGTRNLFKFFTAGPINAFVAANHDKLIIVDDTKLITGGRNISGRYFLRASEYHEKTFRDADIYAEFKEPSVAAIAAFNAEFYSEHSFKVNSISTKEVTDTTTQVMNSLFALEDRMLNENLNSRTLATHPEVENYLSLMAYRTFNANISEKYYSVKCLDKTSMLSGQNNFSGTLFELIQNSNRIVVQNPYVTLPPGIKHALVAAATGPNQANIYLSTAGPTTSDSSLTQSIFNYEWKKVMKEIPRLKVYAYKGASNLHAKIFVFDKQKTLISGYNLDGLSEGFNSEFGLLVDSDEFANAVETSVMKIMDDDSQEYDADKNIGPDAADRAEAKNNKYGFLHIISGLIRSWL